MVVVPPGGMSTTLATISALPRGSLSGWRETVSAVLTSSLLTEFALGAGASETPGEAGPQARASVAAPIRNPRITLLPLRFAVPDHRTIRHVRHGWRPTRSATVSTRGWRPR